LVEESGSMGNTGGRRAKTYDIIKNARVAVGLDITRNHITVVVVDLKGEVILRTGVRHPFERTDEYYRFLGALVDQAVQKCGLAPDKVLGVGIGIPGLVTPDHQKVFYGKILNFTGATCEEFSTYINYPSSLFNDANAAGFAESWFSNRTKNFFYLMLSNNIGGSVVINGEVYNGDHLHSGEIGHLCIVPNGRKCYCGQRGCVDAYLAATELSSLTDGNIGNYFALLKSGNKEAKAVWEQYLQHLALAVNNLYMLFDCTVILGGYVGSYIEEYLPTVRSYAAELNTFENGDASYIEVCSYKTEAIAAGAALNYISAFIDSI